MKMESNFLDEGCDVFMNESEIKNKGKTWKWEVWRNF
jgi:hypothetical protein